MASEKDDLRGFFLIEIRQIETYIEAMKREFGEERYARARHYTMVAASRIAKMGGTLALLERLK